MTMAEKIEVITNDQFAERIVLNKSDALVFISTAWNGASLMVGHSLQDLAPQYPELEFFSIDYDSQSALCVAYRVESEPTILFFKKGKLVDKLSGLTHRTVITHKINQLVNS